MIDITELVQTAFQGAYAKELTLNFPIGRTLTNEDILTESMTLEQSVCDESNLTFGMVYSTCFSVTIFDDGLTYTGLQVQPTITAVYEGSGGNISRFNRDLGNYTVKSDNLTADKIYRELKCYDKLADVLSFDYSEWHNARPDSFTLKQYRDAFFQYVGISQESVSLPNDSVTLQKFTVDKLSGSQLIGAILQLTGTFGFIRINNGKFTYVHPSTTPQITINDNSYIQGTFTYADEPMTSITGVRIVGYSDTYTSEEGEEEDRGVQNALAGNSDGSVYEVPDNFLIHSLDLETRLSIARAILPVVRNFTYYSTAIEVPPYMQAEPGDVIQVVTERKTVTFPVLRRSLSGISALRDKIEAKGEGQMASSAGSVSGGVSAASTAINQIRLSVSELLARKASINDLTASNARITNLEASDVTINNVLNAHRANIETLEANKANVSDLSASNARITTLESGYASIGQLEANYANIKTILAGNAGVGDLQTIHLTTANSVVDQAVIKNLVAQYISVSDLMAGTISTNKFAVASDDGAFTIDGATQTIKDSDGNVRIQMGQDASGNFTFVLYDATGQGVLLDATGIKESGIADGLIKDAKVATDANIKGSKLDIDSVVTEMNKPGTTVIKSNKIWFDDSSQTLTQAFSQMSTTMTNVSTMAQTASDNADAAIRAIEGISSLDNVTAVLSNDSHVVHTNYDGTGGSYTYANTQVSAYKGDADISSQVTITYTASTGLTGTWNASTRTYQVTALTADDGYVDFVVSYAPQSGNAVTVTKRFSVSKSPDGRAGSAYTLQSSVDVVQKSSTGTFRPETVVFSSLESVGSSTLPYVGIYKVEESEDASTWVQKYISSSAEATLTYRPTSSAEYIRCTLFDSNNVYLASKTLTAIPDSQELADELSEAQQSIQTISSRVGVVETGINGLSVELADTQEELHGLADNSLLFQVLTNYNASDIVTLEAKVYQNGLDIHTDYPAPWFSWHKKTEDGIKTIGSGYTMTIDKTSFGYGGTVVGIFETFEEGLLVLPDNKYLVLPDGNRLKLYY